MFILAIFFIQPSPSSTIIELSGEAHLDILSSFLSTFHKLPNWMKEFSLSLSAPSLFCFSLVKNK